MASGISARTAVRSVTSTSTATARPGASDSNRARSSWLRTVPMTTEPRESTSSASARPRPLDTPVISHVLVLILDSYRREPLARNDTVRLVITFDAFSGGLLARGDRHGSDRLV